MTPADMAARFEAIAVELGGVYQDNEWGRPDYGFVLLDSGTPQTGPGVTLNLGGYGRTNRIIVQGVYPTTAAGERIGPEHVLAYVERHTYPREITVGAGRSAAQIAADIRRRFLPVYLPLYERCRAYAERRDGESRSVRATVARLAATVSESRSAQGGWSQRERERSLRSGGSAISDTWFELDVAFSGDGIDRLELRNISTDEAEWILRFLFEGGASNADRLSD